MLGKESFKDGANRFDRYNPLNSFGLSIAIRGRSPRLPPHWRQVFPIWGIDQEGRIPNFFSR